MKRIAIIGAGNAGCITALELSKKECSSCKSEITMYHDSYNYPIEKVGQGSLPSFTELLHDTLDINWYDKNLIDGTIKTGILYKGWEKNRRELFHSFAMHQTAVHFTPNKLSKAVLDSGLVNVIEKNIKDPESEIDADFIFDCRGRYNRDKDNYEKISSPINAVLLANRSKLVSDKDFTYTQAVATPNGWTFVIPNKDTISYGYLYNSEVTSDEEAAEDFMSRFDISEINDALPFENYVAKNMFVGERTILQGNAYGFVEPLEATSLNFYNQLCVAAKKTIFNGVSTQETNREVKTLMHRIEHFLLWHYQFGSKYDTPFWEHAKNLPFNPTFSAESLNEVWTKTEP
jgi:flavin-dependent dehydrogenase